MKPHLLYLRYITRHKWFVFLECLKYGLIWRGIIHDLSKFSRAEWTPYVNYFYGPKEWTGSMIMDKAGGMVKQMEPTFSNKHAFDLAWNHHQKYNSHHWQHYLLSPDNPRSPANFMSMDGAMTHITVTTNRNAAIGAGKDLALVWDAGVPGWDKVDKEKEDYLEYILANTPVPLDMPLTDMQEMLADWRGAGRALGFPDTLAWYTKNRDNIFLSPIIVGRELGYQTNLPST